MDSRRRDLNFAINASTVYVSREVLHAKTFIFSLCDMYVFSNEKLVY